VDFSFTAAQRERYDQTLNTARTSLGRIQPQDAPFTRETWQLVAQSGVTGLCMPPAYGGSGLGVLDTALCLEAFGRGCVDTGLAFAVSAHLLACGVPIRDFASQEVRQQLLPGLVSGEFVAANAITEDEAGSDVGALSMTADHAGADYLLTGEKSFVSNAPAADVLVVYAVTDLQAGFLGITAFALPRELPGISVGPPFQKMGLTSCPAGRVRFARCRVPARYRLGAEGQGGAIFQHSMTWERTCLFAAYVGMMEHQLDRCATHARHRRQFGRSLLSFQAVSQRLAVMKQRLESARLLLYRACWLVDQGHDRIAEIALAKVAVSEAAVANSLDAIQVFGGTGYLADTGIERNLRDAVPSTIFSGTSAIQRELIAREMGLEPPSTRDTGGGSESIPARHSRTGRGAPLRRPRSPGQRAGTPAVRSRDPQG
jgi:clorobiocin biosynthesis protein CloN3